MDSRSLVCAPLLAGGGFLLSLLSAPLPQQDETKAAFQVRLFVIESVPSITPATGRDTPSSEELMKAGGKLLYAPTVRTLDEFPAHIESMQSLPYTRHTGDKAKPTRTAEVRVGWQADITPHRTTEGTVQLDLDLTYAEPAPGGAPAILRHGLFNSLRLKDGDRVSFGTWKQGNKMMTVFAAVTQDKR